MYIYNNIVAPPELAEGILEFSSVAQVIFISGFIGEKKTVDSPMIFFIGDHVLEKSSGSS